MSLHIDQIRLDGGTQSRAAINEATVQEYAEAMADPSTVFPPVTVYFDGKEYWLADGFHRLEAWRQAGRTDIPTEIRQGDRRRAILHSVAANSAHGLRRTNDDKRRAVMTLLEDPEWSQWSNREIARRCAVSDVFVAKMKEAASANGLQIADTRTVTRNGTTYQQNTANIGGRSKPDQEPEAPQSQGKTQPLMAGGPVASNDAQEADPRPTRALTREALTEDLAGLREENAELRAKLAAAEMRIAELERANAELAHSESGRIISDLQAQRDREKTAKGKKMNELAVEARKLRAADKKIADLERELAASREREAIPL